MTTRLQGDCNTKVYFKPFQKNQTIIQKQKQVIMKKIFGILTVITILLLSNVNTYAINITITFGAPTANGCIGVGICSITGELFSDMVNAAHSDMTLTSSGKIKLVFNAQSMKAETLAKNFSNNTFKLDADYTTSLEVMQLLKLSSTYTIKKGIYKVTKNATNNTFELIL